ncbi:hypothetical protein Leryth_012071 [Lithospermum erythrorhizon]|nr:hypothetical protein Leryth_012071 [Lithospermum erythrorhizon]
MSENDEAKGVFGTRMLCGIGKRNEKAGNVPVYLNVYDLTSINGYAYWFGLGVYHSGVQEYAFGAHETSTTGIFEVEPKQCPGFTFRKSILIGRTDMCPKEVRAFMENLAEEYSGNSYNLISKNCNHFCNDVCQRLSGKPIPKWVNRLARLGKHPTEPLIFIVYLDPRPTVIATVLILPQGLFCNCVLPAELKETEVCDRPEDRVPEKESQSTRSSRPQNRRMAFSSPCPIKLVVA